MFDEDANMRKKVMDGLSAIGMWASMVIVSVLIAYACSDAMQAKPATPVIAEQFIMDYGQKIAFDQNSAILRDRQVLNNTAVHIHILRYETPDGLYKAWVLAGYDKRIPIEWQVRREGEKIKPDATSPCFSKSETGVTKCMFFQMRFTKPQHLEIGKGNYKKMPIELKLETDPKPMHQFISAKNNHDYLFQALKLPATVYGLGELMCGDIGKPVICAGGAITASGEALWPRLVRSAAIPAPTNYKMRVKRIDIKINDGKCISVRINDKSNPKWIGKRGLDLTPVAIFESTGKWPSKRWGGNVTPCGTI